MRHKLLIALFAFGAIAGFGSGFHHVAHHCKHRRDAARQELVTECAEAVRASMATTPTTPTPTAATPTPAMSPATVTPPSIQP